MNSTLINAVETGVFILDGSSEIGAHERSNTFLFKLYKALDYIVIDNNFFFSQKRPVFFMRAQHVLSYNII